LRNEIGYKHFNPLLKAASSAAFNVLIYVLKQTESHEETWKDRTGDSGKSQQRRRGRRGFPGGPFRTLSLPYRSDKETFLKIVKGLPKQRIL
jgi:hypothetical protein